MTQAPYFGEALALGSPLAWAFAVLLFRKTGESVPPVALTLFKNTLATLLFGITLLIVGGGAPPDVGPWDYVLLLASGAIGVAVADGLFFMCLNRVGAARQAIINTAYSPPIIFLSVLFLGESLTLGQVLGVVLILGAVLSVSFDRSALSRERPAHLTTGVLLGVGACVTQAISIVMIKNQLEGWPVIWTTTVRMVGGLLAAVLALPLLPRAARDLSSLADRRTWRFMIPGVVVGTYISLLLWMGGFKFADASVASALNQTATLFTFGLAVLILKEPVTRKGLVGLALGLAGVACVTFLAKDAPEQAEPPADPPAVVLAL